MNEELAIHSFIHSVNVYHAPVLGTRNMVLKKKKVFLPWILHPSEDRAKQINV